MALYFGNLYSNTVWISFLYFDATCTPTPFRKIGWWQVDSLQILNVWNTSLHNIGSHAAYFAEEFRDEEGATWSGTGFNWYQISDVRFDQCYDDETNCTRQPDFIPLDFTGSYDDYVIWLGPAAGKFSTDTYPYPPASDIGIDYTYSPQDAPLTGKTTLDVRIDGTYTFSGHYHNSSNVIFLFDMVTAYAFVDDDKNVYAFQHSGTASSSNDDVWEVSGQDAARLFPLSLPR